MTAPLRTLALAALLSAGGAGAASAQADTVTFRFAFPVGTEAQVRYTKVIEREEAGPPTRIEIEGEYSMHVHPHPSGLLIEHLDPLATRFVSSPALAQDDPRRAVYGTIGAPIADWVVSGDGQLLGLSSVDVIQDAVTRALAPLQLDEGAYQAAMAELVSEPALMGNARDLWRAMVESWADAQMVAGEAQADQADEINPIVPSVTLPYRYEYSFVGMEPCPAPSGSCAHLQVVSFPDPRELTRTMSEALQQLGLTNLSFERLVQLNTMTVLTDPTTLLPQAIEVHKQVDGILLQDGRPTVFRRGDQTQLIFTY